MAICYGDQPCNCSRCLAARGGRRVEEKLIGGKSNLTAAQIAKNAEIDENFKKLRHPTEAKAP